MMECHLSPARRHAVAMVLAFAALWPAPGIGAQPTHHCASAATEQAGKLLAFHFGADPRIEIAPAVRTLAPVRNPAKTSQRLDVLEVWGYVQKGQYRMRFLYGQLPGECILVGQEILEYAGL